FSSLRRRLSRRWKSGNPVLGFPLFHRLQVLLCALDSQFDQKQQELWKCGNLAAPARFPRSCGKGGKPALGFPGFHSSAISTALWGCSRGAHHAGNSAVTPLHFRSSSTLALLI